MKFMDIVQNGVLQAYGRMGRRRGKSPGSKTQPSKLLAYKMLRVERYIIGSKARMQISIRVRK